MSSICARTLPAIARSDIPLLLPQTARSPFDPLVNENYSGVFPLLRDLLIFLHLYYKVMQRCTVLITFILYDLTRNAGLAGDLVKYLWRAGGFLC